ncbi:Hydroxyethylthiazole kinase [Mannheimia varigena USDA-ARS-USMARC-1296]|uniref:Hydroxyethylthiazole kinase n=1 Tax=Mannheimia varigena USDA-ARS-USMARC-1296 TaxID=1433287 RepID=W0QAW2_9PAST|nr:hydroxyethylthiazole kinase [Mannheimia varigena]AHG74975.1 Hydroxyethylthiazole kinase [Mannheimia varigena USDA-ARS-USMARC-1296]TLU75116.1 hydroxyethylthiazole kinase [Mannheimia varigena]
MTKSFQSHFLQKIRQNRPLVHNITNIVAANFSANGLLALGASPIMAAAIEEMESVPALSSAVVINIGTLIGKEVEAMVLAGKTANRLGIPVLLDPVGVGATPFRRQTVETLLNEIQFSAIRGNAGELATIAGVAWQAKGVDAGEGSHNMVEIAEQVAKGYQTIVAISGETDVVSNGSLTVLLRNGSPMFPQITASGCLLSAICGAFLAVAEKEQYFNALIEACSAYAVAGEIAAKSLKPTEYGQFAVNLLNELGALTPETVEQYAEVEYV